MPILIKEQLPPELDHPAVKAVFVGGCVKRGDGSSFRKIAHAHVTGPYRGVLCYRAAWRLKEKQLNLHELAHLIVGPRHGHDDTWRVEFLKLGGSPRGDYWLERKSKPWSQRELKAAGSQW